MGTLRRLYSDLKRHVAYYRAMAVHPRTPRLAKWLIVGAIAYVLSPVDLIPDWIPVVGYLDDVLIVPGMIALALWMVPDDVKRECRNSETTTGDNQCPR
jgi:uncharacterized membrane protein YkvA (DUF1232 family)